MLNTLGNNRFVHKGSQWAVCAPRVVIGRNFHSSQLGEFMFCGGFSTCHSTNWTNESSAFR